MAAKLHTPGEKDRKGAEALKEIRSIAAVLAAACIKPGASAKEAAETYRAVQAELLGSHGKVSAKKA